MISTDRINQQLRMLWKEVIESDAWPNHENKLPKLWPLQYPTEIETPTLVFIGLNAAYTIRDQKATHEEEITDSRILLDPNGRSILCGGDTECPESPYFGAFNKFIEDTQLPSWTSVDIFAVKHTDQSLVKQVLGLDDKWTDFANKQFQIFMELLAMIDPPVIVVPNAYASRKLHVKLNVSEMSPEYGCHFMPLNGRQVPIFFSSMLTGQRAMDVYSRERLIYQVRKMITSTLSK